MGRALHRVPQPLASRGYPRRSHAGIASVVASVVEDMIEAGEAVPEAMSDRRYSGSFLTRVPEQLHRTLAIEAAEAGVSLNRLVSYKLSMPVPLAGRPAKAATKSHKAA